MKRIVVGMDGSAGARGALQWAADEAARTGAEVTAVLAWSLLGQPGETFTPTFSQDDAKAAIDGWVREAAVTVPVATSVVCDLPAAALVDASADADLLVVGSRGMGGFKAMLLGSVSSAVAERALCPVAVIRPSRRPDGPVVVGVDGSGHASRSVDFALRAARARGAVLEVVHAWTGTSAPVLGLPAVIPLGPAAEEAAAHAVDAALAGHDTTGVDVRPVVVEGTPAGVLVDCSERAALVVVGSRGRGGLTAILLGSTGRHLLHHAACPVVIVR